jgi:hypothetical protein
LNLVRTLGVLNQAATTSQQTSAFNATNLSNPALTGAQTQAPVQNESQTESPPASISPLQSSSAPATLQANPAVASSEGPATSASNGAAQFRQLQAVFQGGENAQNPQGSTGEHVAPTASLSILV